MTRTSRSKKSGNATSPRRIEPRRIERGDPDLEITVSCLPEHVDPQGNASAIDAATDAAILKWIADELDRGNEWAWCCVEVEVTYRGVLSAKDYLGCCSYENEGRFREDGYFDDMVGVCLDEINAQLSKLA